MLYIYILYIVWKGAIYTHPRSQRCFLPPFQVRLAARLIPRPAEELVMGDTWHMTPVHLAVTMAGWIWNTQQGDEGGWQKNSKGTIN